VQGRAAAEAGASVIATCASSHTWVDEFMSMCDENSLSG